MMNHEATNGHAVHRADAGELSVVVECHALVCAFGLSCVRRLVLPAAVREVGGAIVESDNERYAAWDLGVLFGLRPLTRAWALLDIPYGGSSVSIALRTGACLVVQRIAPETSLPAAAFRARGIAFRGAFDAGAVLPDRVAAGTVGIVIDPARLFEPSELSTSVARLARTEGR